MRLHTYALTPNHWYIESLLTNEEALGYVHSATFAIFMQKTKEGSAQITKIQSPEVNACSAPGLDVSLAV